MKRSSWAASVGRTNFRAGTRQSRRRGWRAAYQRFWQFSLLSARQMSGLTAAALFTIACASSAPAPAPSSGSVPPPNAAGPAAPSVLSPTLATPPPAPLRLTLNWTQPVASVAPVWVAYDTGLFREQGLDIELVNVPGTAQVIQSMIAGEIHISHLDPTSAVRATLEGAELALVLGVNNRFANQILSQPSIQDSTALHGKTLGIGRLGGTYHAAALVALREWQLTPDRDVTLRQFADPSAILAGLEAGQVDAGLATVPVPRSILARFHLLFDLTTKGPEYPGVAMGGPRPWIQANAEAVRRFVRAYVLGDRRARGDKAAALDSFRKYMRADDAELFEDRYASFLTLVPAVPFISETGFATLLQDLAAEEPRVARYQVSDFVDSRFVRELETSGFSR